jgi:hypothetical protein
VVQCTCVAGSDTVTLGRLPATTAEAINVGAIVTGTVDQPAAVRSVSGVSVVLTNAATITGPCTLTFTTPSAEQRLRLRH